jgi:hypothetical protein
MHLHHEKEWANKVFIGNFQPLFKGSIMQELQHATALYSSRSAPQDYPRTGHGHTEQPG